MAGNAKNFILPKRLESYLATLNRLYKESGEDTLREIVVNGAVTIYEAWDYDNWNGGTYGHALTLTVPKDLFLPVRSDVDSIQKRLISDLQEFAYTGNEHISEVFVEMETYDEEDWRKESGVLRPRLGAVSVPAEALNRIWGSGHVRVFLSHKSSVKRETEDLKNVLERCGLSAFVAHSDIEPTEEWAREIERALFSADTLVALLSGDFHDSSWTDQEVGVAIGRGIPVISVRLGCDPYGLMGKGQGLGKCSWDNPKDMAAGIFRVLHKKLGDKARLFESALQAYKKSENWTDSEWKVNNLLSSFEELTDEQIERLVCAFNKNRQNYDSWAGRKALRTLLGNWTGRPWILKEGELVCDRTEESEEEAPF